MINSEIKEEEFDDFLNNLQKYRITATFIALMYLYGFEGEHTKEQCPITDPKKKQKKFSWTVENQTESKQFFIQNNW